MFKVDPEKKDQHVTEGIKKCDNATPKFLSRYQQNIIKKGVQDVSKLKFTKVSSRVNYIISTVTETMSSTLDINAAFKEEVINEIKLIEDMEDDYLLEACLLGNKVFYGGETRFNDYIDRANKEIGNEIAVHSRRQDTKMYSYRWVSTRAMKEELDKIVGPDVAVPCESFFAQQFTTNLTRLINTSKYYHRIDIVRKVQKQTIVKYNVDNRYANTQAKIARKWFIHNSEHTIYISRDDKNKIKVGTPGEPLALAQKKRMIKVPTKIDLSIADHDLCIKTHLTLSVMANINCPANKSPALGNFYDSETVMILKESAVNPSSVFQHASELIIQYKQTDKVFMLLQGDGGFDYNCTTPRSIVANFVIMLELNLEHIVSIRNAGGCSTYNPCERNIGGINFGLQVMACDREESTDEVENAIISSKSIKSFVNKNKNSNPRLINDYMKSVQPCIDKINKTIS